MDRSRYSKSFKVGDVEKEKEIENRLRELGLWENKRRLENHVASMLNAQIEEKDVLSKTLKTCRRRRSDGRTAVDEIRNVISPRVVRDCYGQRLAYHVDVFMDCFTKDVRYDSMDDSIVICGSTAAQDDPTRLTKEIRIELPPSLNMEALAVSYSAGAVKIRVPYLVENLSKSRSSSNASEGSDNNRPNNNNNDDNNNNNRQNKFSSISPIYSLSMQLNDRRRQTPGSPNMIGTSTGTAPDSSPGSVNSETRSVSGEHQLSPDPVFEEDFGSRLEDIPESSFRQSFHLNLTTRHRPIDVRPTNGDYSPNASRSDVGLTPLRSELLYLLPSSSVRPRSSPKFNRPSYMNDVISHDTAEDGKQSSNKSSRCMSELTVDVTQNSFNSAVLSNSSDSTRDEGPRQNLIDFEIRPTHHSNSSEMLSNSEVDDEASGTGRRSRLFIESIEEPSISPMAINFSGAISSHDTGMFSCSATQSFTEENYSDQDTVMIESDCLDSDRSASTNRPAVAGDDRSTVKRRIAQDSGVVSKANQRTSYNSGRISSPEIQDVKRTFDRCRDVASLSFSESNSANESTFLFKSSTPALKSESEASPRTRQQLTNQNTRL